MADPICPHCGEAVHVPADYDGREIECRCGATLHALAYFSIRHDEESERA